jgi:hypothetical protein
MRLVMPWGAEKDKGLMEGRSTDSLATAAWLLTDDGTVSRGIERIANGGVLIGAERLAGLTINAAIERVESLF